MRVENHFIKLHAYYIKNPKRVFIWLNFIHNNHYIFKRLTIKDNKIPMGLELEEIYDRIRMVDHDEYPNAFITYDNLKIEFSSAKIVNDTLEVACVIKKLA